MEKNCYTKVSMSGLGSTPSFITLISNHLINQFHIYLTINVLIKKLSIESNSMDER